MNQIGYVLIEVASYLMFFLVGWHTNNYMNDRKKEKKK